MVLVCLFRGIQYRYVYCLGECACECLLVCAFCSCVLLVCVSYVERRVCLCLYIGLAYVNITYALVMLFHSKRLLKCICCFVFSFRYLLKFRLYIFFHIIFILIFILLLLSLLLLPFYHYYFDNDKV